MKEEIKVHSEEWFKECFKDCDATQKAKKASVILCKKYNINGICDPAYIANCICFNKELNGEDSTSQQVTNKILRCYETNINKYRIGTIKEAEQFIYNTIKGCF